MELLVEIRHGYYPCPCKETDSDDDVIMVDSPECCRCPFNKGCTQYGDSEHGILCSNPKNQ